MAEQTKTLDEQMQEVQAAVARFLAENCGGLCLDNDQEIEEVSTKVVDFLFSPKNPVQSPAIDLPRPEHKLQFRIVDEAKGQHICTLTLQRSPDMSDEGFLQMQNFFWCTIGRSIAGNPSLIRTLQLAGIDVDVDPGHGGGEQIAL